MFFSYTYPYTFSNLTVFLKNMMSLRFESHMDFYGETVLCKSLSGLDIPMITITSRLNSDPNQYNLVKLSEFEDNESKVSIPMYTRKKYVVIVARVHPGETVSSFMIEGIVKYLTANSL